jgi:hypothetical protein
MYGDERAWRPASPAPDRLGLVVRTVVAVLLVEGLVLGGAELLDRRSTPEPKLSGAGSIDPGRSPALEGEPWMDEFLAEQGEVTRGLVYAPFTGSAIRDYQGQHINVSGRVRRSYEPTYPAGSEPIDVWFFGGSTMFGFDAQRDLHTIPSEVVRLAEAEGIPIRARNYGSAGFVGYQEAILLALVTGGGEAPDLAVFYDGVNDVSLQLLNAVGGLNPLGEPGELGAHQHRGAMVDAGVIPGGSPEPPGPLRPPPAERPYTADEISDAVIHTYAEGMELARDVATRRGFRTVHFWQPSIYSKQPLDPGESGRFGVVGIDDFSYEVVSRLHRKIVDELPAGVIDLGDALDDVQGPVLADSVHINERGAAAVAAAMFEHLRPLLEEVRRRG